MDTQLITKVRELTGAGILEVKKALEEAAGDAQQAVTILRQKGVIKAAEKSGRQTKEGLVESYIHAGGRVGALVEVNCETDFVARTETFKELAHHIAMQVAAANPLYLRAEDVPGSELAHEREVYRELLRKEGKPEEMIEKIAESKLQKYFSEVCLYNQPFIKDDKKTVEQVVKEAVATVGENIQVKRFCRFSL